jgi:integrase
MKAAIYARVSTLDQTVDNQLLDLRHTCASLLLAQGVQPRVVMETLGHSQISITMDTYSHVMPALSVKAAQKMNAALG